MPRIKHIALTTKDPAETAAFYKEAFGLQEIRRAPNGAVFLTDGYINVAILNWKTEKSADVGAHGPNFSGIHHFGFEVERAPLRDCVDFSGYKELDPAGVLRQGGSRSFMAPMVEHVVACLRGREVPISRGEDGMAALEVLLAIAESANARGQRIALRS